MVKMELPLTLVVFISTLLVIKYASWRSQTNKIIRSYTDKGVIYLGNTVVNIIRTVLNGEHFSCSVTENYSQLKKSNQKLGFEMVFGKPTFLVTDLELIKQITIEDFDHFTHSFPMDAFTKSDDLISRGFNAYMGPNWKQIRAKIWSVSSPAKVKRVFPLINSSSKKWMNYLKTQTQKQGIVNMEDGCSKFVLDFISLSNFGWDTKIFENLTPSLFEKMASNVGFDAIRMAFQLILMTISLSLPDLIGWAFIDLKTQDFFRNVIGNTIQARDQNRDKKHNDIIEILLEMRDEQESVDRTNLIKHSEVDSRIPLEDVDIAAHSMFMFLPGTESIPIVLQYTAYNLALWPAVQERLFQELRLAFEQNDGQFHYEMINNLKYLHGVICESQRINPMGAAFTRVCNKSFCIPDTSIMIPKGSTILIPLAPVHNDPDYYPNPEVFDPERFMPENVSKLYPNAYLQFGQGPRMCPGMNLGLMELKTAIAHLVVSFVLEPCEKTQVNMKYDIRSITWKPSGGIWLKLKSRTKAQPHELTC